MCYHGTHKLVRVINKQNKQDVVVDACIADEIQHLNNMGVVTLGCCCGHGKAGQIVEWENGFGKWKGYEEPPHALIHKDSVFEARLLGYSPYPYYYANGEYNDVWQMHLRTGCVTEEECEKWDRLNNKNTL